MASIRSPKFILAFVAGFALLVILNHNGGNINIDLASGTSNETDTSNLPYKFEKNGRCQGDERHRCIPPLHVFEKRFRAAPKYKINVCAIEKNLSTIMTAIMCFLFDEKKFSDKNRNLNEEMFHQRFCRTRNEATSIDHLERKFKTNATDWLHLAIVREPIERFVSGFVDKCVIEQVWIENGKLCNMCRKNITCFAERQYKRMVIHSNGGKLNNFDDRHFFPQSWRCDFSAHFRRFTFLQYKNEHTEPFLQTLYTHLESRNVSNSTIEIINKQLHDGKTRHATVGLSERDIYERQVRSDPYILQYIIWMYYYDFVLFGFPLPEVPAQKVQIKIV
uniref:Carbohydrate sulfotransferase n=1 Tax=Panagrellus redivivus TaxID=6233 RepID=A0A7E4VDF3_PANRE